jgi:2-dehydro-3-deoxyphosphogluconate aldolase/(4S)-4-hydroxy-2-oxoglutarate aldolase
VVDAVARLGQERLVAVLRVDRADLVEPAVAALVQGGLGAVELTFTTQGVERELERTRASHPDVLLGAGTIRHAAQARAAAAAGAQFLVTPHFDRRLLEACMETGLPAVPGVFTASELAAAADAGAELFKLFPAGTAGPAHLKALRGPFPDVRIVPTGGIGLAQVPIWLEAGAFAVGVGGELCSRALIEAARFDELADRARTFKAALA